MMVFFVTIILLLCVSHALPPPLNITIPDPEHVVRHLNRKVEESRRRALVSTCFTGNPIDDCWRCDPNWFQNRQRLADCAVGFGRDAAGGKGGAFYVVTDNTDDATNPAPGSLRFGVIQEQPLWIIFSASTTIHLQQELVVNSFKTIDGRGVDVHITGNGCITIQGVSNVIIHNVNVHHCVPAGNAEVRGQTDGDGISIHSSRHIWIDHCSLSYCADGLIDATIASTSLTFSNNHFSNHDKVMLLGHSDSFPADKVMQVTVAFNHFADALVQRMPRARFGYVHVVNNDYTAWGMYAVGGSAAPTINSQGNRYIAPADETKKEVTKRVGTDETVWGDWNWRSEGDLLVNGAFFVPSGVGGYEMAASVEPMSSAMIDQLTKNAGVMSSGVVGGAGGGTGGGGSGGGGSPPGGGSGGQSNPGGTGSSGGDGGVMGPGGGSGGPVGGSGVGPDVGSGDGGGGIVGPGGGYGDGGGGIVGPGGGYGDGNGGPGYGGYGMIYSGGAIARTSHCQQSFVVLLLLVLTCFLWI